MRDDYAADIIRLPEGCIADILSLTTPPDVGRLSAVSSIFRSAADSDAVWERFLPADYLSVLKRSEGCHHMFQIPKKQLFLSLCHSPLLIDGGKKGFFLNRSNGKKCYMIAARDLTIVWGDTPSYWKWMYLPESRFSEVAELRSVCWLEIHGRIDTCMLSEKTNYAAYLVFMLTASGHGFDYQPVEASVGITGRDIATQSVYLEPEEGRIKPVQIVPRHVAFFTRRRSQAIAAVQAAQPPLLSAAKDGKRRPKERKDGWLEIELGEYFVEGCEDKEFEMSLMEVKSGHWKGGLIIQGIEIRPKESRYS